MNRLHTIVIVVSLGSVCMLGGCKEAKRDKATDEAMARAEAEALEEAKAEANEREIAELNAMAEASIAEAEAEAAKERAYLESLSAEDLLTGSFWPAATRKAVEHLVGEGADINARDANGWTPIMWAVKTGKDPDIIMALIALNADFSVEAGDGNTVYTLIAKNDELKDSAVHRDLDSWRQNNLHQKMALERESAQKSADAQEAETPQDAGTE